MTATEEDTANVERLATAVEGLNPTAKPLSSPLINGRWELIYTTSSSILGKNKLPFLRPVGPIYQLIGGCTLACQGLFNCLLLMLSDAAVLFTDAKNLIAANEETTPFYNKVSMPAGLIAFTSLGNRLCW